MPRSLRAKVAASCFAVLLVSGVCAGAGVLIYQSTSSASVPSVVSELVSDEDLKRLFPDGLSFEHYEFLADVKATELPLDEIVDVRSFASDNVRAFLPEEERIATAFFANALKNSTHWRLHGDYLRNPNAFKKTQSVKRFNSREIRVVFGVAAADKTVYYDAGRILV